MITSMATTTKRGATKKASTRAKSAATSKKTTTKKTTKKTTTKKAAAPKKTTSAKVTKAPKNTAKKTDVFKQLNIWNWVLAVLALGQGVALFVLSETSKVTVTTNYLTEDKLSGIDVVAQRTLFDFNILYLLLASLGATAVLHALLASVLRKRYESQVSNGVNVARWIGLSVTVATVMLTISMLAGVTDLSALILIAVASASTGLLAIVREARGTARKATTVASILVALAPWIAVALYLIGANKYGDGSVDSYIYVLVASAVVILSLLDVNMYLNNKKTARWADYTYTDRVYMLVNFVLVSAVAWQVYVALLAN